MGGSASALPPLIVTVPIAGACVLLLLGRIAPRRLVDALALLTALATAILAGWLLAATGSGAVVTWVGGWHPGPRFAVGIVLIADRLGAAMVLLIAVLATTALLFGWRYFDTVRAHYPALLLLFTAGMAGYALTGDLFDMFVFFELMSVAAYALTGLEIEEPEAVQGGLNFAVVNSLGAYLCLFGIGLLYARTGQLGLPQLSLALSQRTPDALVLIAFGLIATGWLVKAAAVPFHFWLADAHAVAPTPVCVLFSGAMAPLGIYGVARVYCAVFDTVLPAAGVHRMMLVLAVCTALLGTVMCVLQRHIKRLLAYSTIAHIGLFLLGLAALTPEGVAAAAVYLAGHAAVKGALFLMAGILLSRYRSLDEVRLYGRARRHRVVGAAFLLGGLMLSGIPLSGTGFGKSLLEESAHSVPLTALVIAVSALTGAAVLRVGLRVFFGAGRPPRPASEADETTGAHETPDADTPPGRIPATMLAAVFALLSAGVLSGLPGRFGREVAAAAAQFCDRIGYRDRALSGVVSAQSAPDLSWTLHGTILGLVSAGAAVTLALLGIHRRNRLGDNTSRSSAVMAVRQGLHRLHSGHLGDYAAWLVFGCAAVIGLLWVG
ncbi:complex I subunit 5 family protein [Nocardia nova]|uniref:complex I subunit 5 family protein n=1 Tax=Nocardia nova TaxID=37330 RepID=UPI00378BBE5A